MADVLVTQAEKAKVDGGRECIVALGNPNTPQGGWRWPSSQVIASIRAGTNTFFLRDGVSGKRYDIIVAYASNDEAPRLVSVDEDQITDHLDQIASTAIAE